jgi:hypothetical protein
MRYLRGDRDCQYHITTEHDFGGNVVRAGMVWHKKKDDSEQ